MTTPELHRLTVDVTSRGRADAVVAHAAGISRTKAVEWIQRGFVLVNHEVAVKSTKLRAGDSLTITIPNDPDPLEVKAEFVQDLIVVDDEEHYVVIDKPVGVAAHPSQGWRGPTVVGGLAALGIDIATSGPPERQGIVQRLDVGTSGLMVVAKTEVAYSRLKQAFHDRTPTRNYHAMLEGLPDPLSGTIDAPIDRMPGYEWRFGVVEGGKQAITEYQTLESFGTATLVDVRLRTGRTHQIRVHFSALNHPLVGDLTYGADAGLAAELGLTRQWLHAVGLGFNHPVTGQFVSYTTDYSMDLQYALDRLRE
ncbi:RluA family pseudouridine synthase [Enteractinococcus coprophilus]|uniref:Pseudouridine synthase n=1 Tax=Enteractinococcus coprophilus TaxID=1027633 RepID=A0A543AJS7_9MICC|nr:RluA family pseudouridine synthase [Enteractinococcus coprophilus]TQL72830.1 23S rRNA pseudouridine1911/1915/1917 synthase [Enteractinococcus coprophilus]